MATVAVSLAAQTSTTSIAARSTISSRRLANFAIFASVPASTIVFVMTLCACRLYSGTMVLLPEPELDKDVKEDVDMDE